MGNKRKRDKVHQPPWISVYRHTWNSPAWKHLSVGARATYVELAANYNTKRKNAVYIAARKGAKQLGVHKDYITQWLRELEHYGFIIKVCGPHLGLDGEARATRYRLTDRWYGDKPPTYDFEKWDGVLFEVQKRIDRRGISRLHAHRKNRIPSPTPRTPRPDTTDRKANGRGGQNGVERPDTTDRRDDAERPDTTDGTSLTSCCGLEGGEDAPDQHPTPQQWTTPTLTEIERTDRPVAAAPKWRTQ